MDEPRATAEQVCGVLRENGFRALFAGGCVRDMLLGVPSRDFDVATDARPQEVTALFPKTLGVGAAFGVVLVVTQGGPVEVATFRGDGPYLDGRHPSSVEFLGEREDAMRRDFTINAMFLDPETNDVVDYVGGQADLRARLVRAVGDPETRFFEDHLRLLRAVRFAARLDFALEPATFEAVRSLANNIVTVSAERIRDELTKMLTEGGARRAFELLDSTGLLEHVLPEIGRMKGIAQPPEFHPEGDVFVHTLMLLEYLEGVSPTLAFGALLHDVGKPATITYEDRIRFNNHDKVGAEMARTICHRLRMSNDDTERIGWLVEQHMRLAHAPDMRPSKLKRFVREEGFRELLELGRFDCLASHGNLETIHWIEEYLSHHNETEYRPKPLLNGNDLIAMGYRPGPEFKCMLTAMEDAQLEGQITTPDAARDFLLKRWPPA